jgi:hypothetical protein
MVRQERVIELNRSVIRLEAVLCKASTSKVRVHVIEFKPAFLKCDDPDSIGAWGHSIYMNQLTDIDEAIGLSDILESEFSFFLESMSTYSTPSDDYKVAPEALDRKAEEFSLWACTNVHVNAYLHKGREVFVLSMRDAPGPKASDTRRLYRLGASEQQHFFLAMREISDELRKLKARFYRESLDFDLKATNESTLPPSFGPSLEVIDQQIMLDKEALNRDLSERVQLHLAHGKMVCGGTLRAIQQRQSRGEPEPLPMLGSVVPAKPKVRSKSPTNRVRKAAPEKIGQFNDALSKGPLPWPSVVSRSEGGSQDHDSTSGDGQ